MCFKSGRRPVMPILHYFYRYFHGVTWDMNRAKVRCKWAVFDFSPWFPSDRVQHRLPYTLKLLNFEGSTIISEKFEQVKHQFVWPDMLLKWLIGKTNGHEESQYKFELFQAFFWIEVCVVLKDVCLLWQTRKPPSCSNFQVKVRL